MPGFHAGSMFRQKKKKKTKRHAEVLKKLLKWGISLKSSKQETSMQKASLVGADEWPLGLVHDVVFH